MFADLDLDVVESAWVDFTQNAFEDCSHAIFIVREHGFENTSWPNRLKQYFDMIKKDIGTQEVQSRKREQRLQERSQRRELS